MQAVPVSPVAGPGAPSYFLQSCYRREESANLRQSFVLSYHWRSGRPSAPRQRPREHPGCAHVSRCMWPCVFDTSAKTAVPDELRETLTKQTHVSPTREISEESLKQNTRPKNWLSCSPLAGAFTTKCYRKLQNSVAPISDLADIWPRIRRRHRGIEGRCLFPWWEQQSQYKHHQQL